MHEKTASLALEFLAKTLITFLLLEALLFPFRQAITGAFAAVLHGWIPESFGVSWECTALDEVLLLASALWWSGGSARERAVKIMTGTAVVEAYNVARILLLARFPHPLLHDVLFRWGGFLVITATYYLLARQRI